MNARFIWIVVFASVAVVLALVGVIGLFVFGIFRLMDATDAHRCGMAFVQADPQTVEMLGQPIEQKWFTSGSTNDKNGRLEQDVTFTVAGPKGEATVEASGVRSDLDSHLTVRIGRGGQSRTIYDGTFDCTALHPGAH